MVKLGMRCVLAFHVAFLLLALGNCQYEDETASSDDSNFANDYDDNNKNDDSNKSSSSEEDAGGLRDYADNRIDAVPTYVSPVEKLIKALITPFSWLSRSNDEERIDGKSASDPQMDVPSFLQGITKPIRNIVGNTGRAVRGGFGEVLNMIGDRFKAIYPGTEWCGAGNVAKNPEEVGLFKKTDSCCREHDHCNNNLEAGATDNGLLNSGIFTRSHCLCDAHFYYCLKEANTLIATNIGFTYFNVLRPQCFKEERPAHCVKYGRNRLRNNKCLEYDYDNSKNKTWQWFDTPDFL